MEIRHARADDLDRIAELERAIFGAQAITPFERPHFAAWLDVYPDGFLVAERDGAVVGYAHAQRIDFDPRDPRALESWVSFDAMTDAGFTLTSHRPGGNHHLGVNIGSISPGAGRLIVEAMFRLADASRCPMLGMSRISGLARHVERLRASGCVPSGLDSIALSYVLQCAAAVNGRVQLVAGCPGIDSGPIAAPPPLEAPDPVLSKYLRNPRFVVLALLPRFMRDPASLDYAVLIRQAD